MATETDADVAARARVDAASIERSAKDVSIIRLVDVPAEGDVASDVDLVPIPVSTTNTVAMFQGSGSVPGDGGDENQLRDVNTTDADRNGVMTLTATRTGNAVTFKATADNDPDDTVPAMVLIDIDDAVAGADGMTSHMEAVDLPGGVTKNIFLMSDIEATTTGTFGGANLPAGLGDAEASFDVATQYHQARYSQQRGIRWRCCGYAACTADRRAHLSPRVLSIRRTTRPLDITLGAAFTPSVGESDRGRCKMNAMFRGTYAGVPGYYICT